MTQRRFVSVEPNGQETKGQETKGEEDVTSDRFLSPLAEKLEKMHKEINEVMAFKREYERRKEAEQRVNRAIWKYGIIGIAVWSIYSHFFGESPMQTLHKGQERWKEGRKRKKQEQANAEEQRRKMKEERERQEREQAEAEEERQKTKEQEAELEIERKGQALYEMLIRDLSR